MGGGSGRKELERACLLVLLWCCQSSQGMLIFRGEGMVVMPKSNPRERGRRLILNGDDGVAKVATLETSVNAGFRGWKGW